MLYGEQRQRRWLEDKHKIHIPTIHLEQIYKEELHSEVLHAKKIHQLAEDDALWFLNHLIAFYALGTQRVMLHQSADE
ncbi:unnamed protein product [Caenorhabditis nigoni]